MAPLKPPYLKWYDLNASCMYQTGNQWHSTENCLAFKRRVQGLIDADILRFDGASNTTGNPLPNHTEGNVSAVIKEDKWRAKSCVSEIKTPLRMVWEIMVKKGRSVIPTEFSKKEVQKVNVFVISMVSKGMTFSLMRDSENYFKT